MNLMLNEVLVPRRCDVMYWMKTFILCAHWSLAQNHNSTDCLPKRIGLFENIRF